MAATGKDVKLAVVTGLFFGLATFFVRILTKPEVQVQKKPK